MVFLFRPYGKLMVFALSICYALPRHKDCQRSLSTRHPCVNDCFFISVVYLAPKGGYPKFIIEKEEINDRTQRKKTTLLFRIFSIEVSKKIGVTQDGRSMHWITIYIESYERPFFRLPVLIFSKKIKSQKLYFDLFLFLLIYINY